ncbi:hypothetical protein EC957_006011 [Mortierella hygrophila]|uniref:Pirin n=1 Tax=Mortierella hygrophila TaxID=979708 RepID=A0A9P6JZC4_9FUNG|nr:hypothetical protein EC957_006011 [Mortierella hygrophila]
MLASRALHFRTPLSTLSAAAVASTSKSRHVLKSIYAAEREEGMGATVRRSLGTIQQHHDDPFLLLDEFWVGSQGGFPDHPHRGFETVTYLFRGQMQHEDFAGHKGTIGPGDLQWMTAGRGVVHCEMPSSAVAAAAAKGKIDHQAGAGAGVSTNKDKSSSRPSQDPEATHGLQLWVNLSQKDKRCDPAYQDLRDDQIPRAKPQDGVEVKVIAGEAHGVKSKVYTRTPTMYLDYRMRKNQTVEQAVPKDYSGFVYMLSGKAYFGGDKGFIRTIDNNNGEENKKAVDLLRNHAVVNSTPEQPFKGQAHQALILSRNDGTDHLRIDTTDEEAHFVILLGEPLKEPIVMDRLFIMNTKEETQQALQDFREAKNGFERAKEWRSTIAPKGYRLKF